MRSFKSLNLILQHKSFRLLLFSFLVIAVSPVIAQTDKTLIREGNKSYNNKKYSDAEVSYKKSLGKNQKSYEGNFNLGDAYYKQGKYDEAAKQFELLKSQKKDKKTEAAAMHNLGNTLLQNKKYEESIEAYKQSLKINPADEDTRYNLAYAQAMLKQQQQQQQQQQQNQDKNNKDKKDQQKQQQQKQEQQKQEQAQQKQQEQKKEISKEDAERILQALNNDEKDKHKKKAKVAATRIRIDKDW
jgi:Ca-activated chloride channel family protein